MTASQNITSIIFDEMKKQGISYRRFAEMIGCSYNTFSRWKSGTNGVTVDVADKALKALGITVEIGANGNE